MTLSKQISKQIREVLLDGTWVATNYKTQLSDVTWKEATKKIESYHTIAILTFHIDYYLSGLIQVFKGGSHDIKDEHAFNAPAINSEEEWKQRVQKLLKDAETFANIVEQISDETLMESFVEKQYGNNYINIQALIEHCYYHLGQIVLIKKLLKTNSIS